MLTAAAAKTKDDGSAAGATVMPGMEVYQFTKAGLALQASVLGTKF
jgi:hypothetical protein